MVLKDTSYMNFMYQNPVYLNYLRFNPHWYKILYYDNTRLNEFIEEAKRSMHLTTADKLEGFQQKLNFITQITSYLNK